MNRMRTTGSRKISDTCDSDAYAMRTSQTAHSPIGFPGSLRNSLESSDSGLGLYTSANLRCHKFRDHVNFDARAEWHLRHTDGTAGMDAPLAEHLDK